MSGAGGLDPVRLRARLRGHGFVRRLVVRTRSTSTQDDARRLARAGAPEGTVVVAGEQTAGRGRLGRTWHSPPGLGVYLSVLLRPRTGSATAARWTLAASVAACLAARDLTGRPVRIRWPNDVRYDDRKLAGILSEMRTRHSRVDELVVGMGLNVNHLAPDFPPELSRIATSLRLVAGGEPVDPTGAAVAYLDALAIQLRDLAAGRWSAVLERWLSLAPEAEGARVRLRSPAGPGLRGGGVTRGLDEDGALRVRLDDGRTVTLHSGAGIEPVEERSCS